MKKYEHNWATVAMIQGNLKNFRGRARRLARTAENDTGDDMEIDPGTSRQDEVDAGTGGEDDPPVSRPPSPAASNSGSSDSSEEDYIDE